MNEFAETHKREADSENKEEISASKKLRVESSEENASKEVSFLIEADAAEDKGLRHSMEDEWVVLLDAARDYPGNLRCAHFAIYDGHGGRLAAEYAQKHLHGNVLAAGLPRELLDVKTAKRSILDGFRKTDESLLRESSEGGWQDGATAVCVWVLGQKVFVANVGDAKAVLARATLSDGSQDNSDKVPALKAIVLTREHKPIFPQERARIQKV
jgi:integrin-linked kinase-associated serine/threonine phosphatase 2C